MSRPHRLLTTGALIVCLVSTQWSGTLFASEEELSSRAASSSPPEAQGSASANTAAALSDDQPASAPELRRSPVEPSGFTLSERLAANWPLRAAGTQVGRSTIEFGSVESSAFAQRGGYRGRGRRGRSGSAAAIVLGAAASIAGGAILVYGNRPECRENQRASGCGYGTKVVGGAVLSAGIVGLVVGALTWR